MQLVHRSPGGNGVVLRAQTKHRPPNIPQHHRPTLDEITSLGQIVVAIQAVQVVAVLAVGHAGGVGIPGHQVRHRCALSQPVIADDARKNQVALMQPGESARHLLAVEKALV